MKNFLFGIVLLVFLALKASAQDSRAIVGLWLTQTGDGKVQIYRKGEKYFGRLVWIKSPDDANGKPKKDINNPDQKLQQRLVLGMELLSNLEYREDSVYDKGTIYDPNTGSMYNCRLILQGAKLMVRGSMSIFSRTDTWTRLAP